MCPSRTERNIKKREYKQFLQVNFIVFNLSEKTLHNSKDIHKIVINIILNININHK